MAKAKQQKFETDQTRVDTMMETLRGVLDAKDSVRDSLAQLDEMRRLAERLRVPFVAVHLLMYEDIGASLQQADIEEWTAWRAALGKEG